MIPDEARQQFGDAIEALREPINDAVLADMYRNPFWDDRYGARGRLRAREDNNHHLDYLIAALRTGTPALLTDYSKWLQSLLVSHGMCTQHIRETLDSIVGHLGRLLPDAGPAIAPYQTAFHAGLAYDDPACRALAAREQAIADTVTAQVYAAEPLWEQQFGARGRDFCRQDNLYHLSYLQDSVGVAVPAHFATYLEWLLPFLGRHGLSAEHVRTRLRILAAELATELEAPEAHPFLALLAAAAPPPAGGSL